MKKTVQLPAPLFRDPIYDCPTDPTVIWNRAEKQWYLFYTQRRCGDVEIGVSWVHGTAIGVASSPDGAKWLYRGTLQLPAVEQGHNTFWAPEILWAQGHYHMYVSYITGIPTDWDYPRQMLHFVSDDLWNWNFESRIDLHSDRVIDACVYEISPGRFKMWYKDEARDSRTWAAESVDLCHWTVCGEEISDCAQEGPNVFELGGVRWMISDFWNGLAVYRSDDFCHWSRCADILRESGSRPMDQGLGHHADVLVLNDRAFLFYFCHPCLHEAGGGGEDPKKLPASLRNRAVIQAAELLIKEGQLVCDRNAPVCWDVTDAG